MGLQQRSARFILRSYGGEILHEYLLDKPLVTIGRASTRDISLPQDKLISRQHAIISYEDGNYILRDEGSSNGTIVNGQMIQAGEPYQLQDGDQITIGRLLFSFQLPFPAAHVPPDAALKSSNGADAMPVPATTGPSFTEPMHSLSTQRLRFTTFYPQNVAMNEWYALLLYAYAERAGEIIYRDAASFGEEQWEAPCGKPDPVIQQLFGSIPVTVIPECPGVLFNPKRVTLKWQKDWQRVEFRFAIKSEDVNMTTQGRISVFAGPLLIAALPMTMLVSERGTALQAGNKDVTSPFYKHLFTSYTPADKVVAQTCYYVSRMLGMNPPINVDEERSEQVLKDSIKRLIDTTEIFQLFWSSRAAQSNTVTMEWQHALSLNKGEEFLRPVYWNIPRAPLPGQLAAFPFTYLPLYSFIPGRI